MTPKDEPTGSEGIQYAAGEEQRAILNGPRENEVDELKWKRCSIVDVSGGERKFPCCKNNSVKILCWPQQTPFSNSPRDDSTHGHQQMVNSQIRLSMFFAAEDGEALYSQQKQDPELTVAPIMCTKIQA